MREVALRVVAITAADRERVLLEIGLPSFRPHSPCHDRTALEMMLATRPKVSPVSCPVFDPWILINLEIGHQAFVTEAMSVFYCMNSEDRGSCQSSRGSIHKRLIVMIHPG